MTESRLRALQLGGELSLPRLRQVGDQALLLECGSLQSALRVFAALEEARERGMLEVSELIPAAETVLVIGGVATRPAMFAGRLAAILESHTNASETGVASETVIPVVYDGEDLAEVAALTGMSVDQVIARHTARVYLAAFTGFAPGFTYLTGGDPQLVVPRRETPRLRVPAGALGLAGAFSGVYPRESPGGWQLIGHTSLAMWDLARENPAAIVPGSNVRFLAERERVSAATASAESLPNANTAGSTDASVPDRFAALEIVDAGLQTLIQDGGRPGHARLGVSPSGAADRRALESANAMVGNDAHAAALELSAGGFSAEALEVLVIALSGAPRDGRITGAFGSREVEHGRPIRLNPGERLILAAAARGVRTVLAIRGGVTTQETLGSLSRDTLAGLGPAPISAGDVVWVGYPGRGAVGFPEPEAAHLPAAGEEVVLRCVLGPRDEWFDAEALRAFGETAWEVTGRSDRVGVRLAGQALTRSARFATSELPSEGMVAGAIQVPRDGQPVLFLADHPLTGGYPVVAVVLEADLSLAAQLPAGAAVRFEVMLPDGGDNSLYGQERDAQREQ